MASPGNLPSSFVNLASQAKDLASDMAHLHNTMMTQSQLYKTNYMDLQDRLRVMEQKLPSIIRKLAGIHSKRETLYGMMGRFCELTEEDYYWMAYHQDHLEILSDSANNSVRLILIGINDVHAKENAGETFLSKLFHIVFKLRNGRPMGYEHGVLYRKLLDKLQVKLWPHPPSYDLRYATSTLPLFSNDPEVTDMTPKPVPRKRIPPKDTPAKTSPKKKKKVSTPPLPKAPSKKTPPPQGTLALASPKKGKKKSNKEASTKTPIKKTTPPKTLTKKAPPKPKSLTAPQTPKKQLEMTDLWDISPASPQEIPQAELPPDLQALYELLPMPVTMEAEQTATERTPETTPETAPETAPEEEQSVDIIDIPMFNDENHFHPGQMDFLRCSTCNPEDHLNWW